jgi:hypothetical protein
MKYGKFALITQWNIGSAGCSYLAFSMYKEREVVYGITLQQTCTL